ncbi:unnamed protein product [Microthlaspi erraticum]|uniref:Uncharacterized protein n=1 Tax=Microthlaspi erraticum TaxID=1685480 RepID=A0A6D2KEH4_9BRAS|nr:unnamed protein product [Microthlaspi erraticum]
MERVVKEKEKELIAKEEERHQISEENKDLKKNVEVQSFNVRDVERMKRELQAVERDVAEAESARDGWEQKAWELNSQIRNQFHQIQTLAIEYNQALRRLKLDIQFAVSEKGEVGKVLGLDYKSEVKPALSSLYDAMEKVETQTAIQQQASEMASKMEAEKSHLGSVQLQINELEERIRLVRKEGQAGVGYTMRLGGESNVGELQEAVKQSEEEVQACVAKLFALVDSISKHKEYMDSKISEMKNGVANTATAVSEIHKASLKRHFGST